MSGTGFPCSAKLSAAKVKLFSDSTKHFHEKVNLKHENAQRYMADFISTYGLEERRRELEQLMTTNPATRKELQAIIKKAINEARHRIVEDAKDVLENDPREAYRAVRSSVYKQILGGQVNILSPRSRGAGTKYQRPRKLDQNPTQRGGNRRKRSRDTIRIDSYQGKDRGFILRFQNAGTVERETRFGKRGSLRARQWFGRSSAFQMDAAAKEVAQEIEKMLASEFKIQ